MDLSASVAAARPHIFDVQCREEPYNYRILKTYVVREVWEYLLIICFGTEKLWILLWLSSFYDPMKMENNIREGMEEMFDYERKSYRVLQNVC